MRNSGPDSTRRPGPATDQVHGSGPGTGILCSSHRRYDQVLGSELVGFHVVGRVERRGATGVRRAGFCAVCQRAEAKRASMAIVAACFRATAACFRAKVAGRPALGGEDGPRACRVPADGRGVVAATLTPSGSTQTSRPWDSAYHGPHGQRLAEAARAFPTLWRPSARRRSRPTIAGQEPLRWFESRTCW